MIRIDYSFASDIRVKGLGVSNDDWNDVSKACSSAIDKLISWRKSGDAAFLELPLKKELDVINEMAKLWSKGVKDVLVIGGGVIPEDDIPF